MFSKGFLNAIPLLRDVQGIVSTREFEEPVSSRNQLAIFHHSLSISPTDILNSQSVWKLNFELETGEIDDSLYNNNVIEVACTNETCNKRTSYVGQEWSAGRTGNRPIGANDAARNSKMWLGPYATHAVVQSLTRAATPVIQNKHRQEDPDQKISTTPASQQQVL